MTVFHSGANGATFPWIFYISSSITSDVPHPTEIDASYANGMRSVLTGSFNVTSSGGISGGTLTGWTAYNSDGSLDFSLTGFSVDVSLIQSGANIGSTILGQDVTYYGSSNPNASDSLFGQGNDTFVAGAATEVFQPGLGVNTIKGGSGKTTVKFTGALAGYSIVNNGNDTITVTDSVASRNGIDHISGAQTLQFSDISVSLNSDGTLSMPSATAGEAVAWSKVGDLSPLTVSDYESTVLYDLAALQSLSAAGELKSITLKDSGNIQMSLTPAQLTADSGALNAITNKGIVVSIDASAANLTMAGIGGMTNGANFTNVFKDYIVTNNQDGSLTITDTGTGRVSVDHLSGFNTLSFLDVTLAVDASGTLSVPYGVSSTEAISWNSLGNFAAFNVRGFSPGTIADLDGLEALSKAGKLASITFTDSGPITLYLTPTQVSADSGALQSITNAGLAARIDASAANLTLTGVPAMANIAVFSGGVSDYSITPNSDGSLTVTDIMTGRTSTDILNGFTALQFTNELVYVAKAPGGAGSVTSGNITELYSASLGRVPDANGLGFYQSYLKSNPGTALATFAQFFLSSSEYTGNSAHNYAQTDAGESQFITDLYTNLLHRSPDSSAVPFYLNVITQQLSHDTPGTAQYAADDKIAHALVLTYISQSSEFLSDVQITAQNPANAQHWLILS